MTTYRTVSEWGSKARKEEANLYRGNNHRAAIEEQMDSMDVDEPAGTIDPEQEAMEAFYAEMDRMAEAADAGLARYIETHGVEVNGAKVLACCDAAALTDGEFHGDQCWRWCYPHGFLDCEVC